MQPPLVVGWGGLGGSRVRTSFPTGLNTFSGFGFERVFSPAEILNIPDASSLRQDLAVIFEQLDGLASNYVALRSIRPACDQLDQLAIN